MIEHNFQNKTALALGNFDGLHSGHLQVLSAVAEQRENGWIPALVHFDIHPALLLRGAAPDRILTDSVRREVLAEYGLQEIVISFEEVHTLSPARFVKEILIDRYHAAFVACGFNYHFGKNGEGTAQTLQVLAAQYHIKCFVAPEVTHKNSPVSATRIRACLKAGDVEQANTMLTRPFSYDFEVVGGDRRGRLMGTPTMNQFFPAGFLVPKHGVYASFVRMDGNAYPAVTNIGLRPTFDGTSERSETWIMDYSGDLYGKQVPVYLLSHLRGEVKFDSMAALRNQIMVDAMQSREAFEIFQKKLKKTEKKA